MGGESDPPPSPYRTTYRVVLLSDTHIYIIILFSFGGHPPNQELGSRPHYDFEL